MDIIDFHTHPYLTQEENSCMYREGFSLEPEEAKEDLLRAGIGRISGSVIRPRSKFDRKLGFSQIKELNDSALRLKERFGSFYIPGFHIHPAFVRESLETIEFMHQNGYRLIGELVPYMHGWQEYGMGYGCKELSEILKLAGEYHMIVSYHTMPEQQDQMEAMIAANPMVTFVAAHPGEREGYLLHLERMKKYDNAYLDLSGTGMFRYGMLRFGILQAGAGRLLFGTDYPITNPGMYVEAVRFEHIREEERELIFHKNAERILGIGCQPSTKTIPL
ncbi:MAG: amidohydrolase [Hungatella sp.]|nr:amidohydrolase [Hungatella sp.]